MSNAALRHRGQDGGLAEVESKKLAIEFRTRAAELRALAPQFKLPENRAESLAMAERYERMAQRLERAAS